MIQRSQGPEPHASAPTDGEPAPGSGLDFDEAVFAVVAMIPSGKVLSYGDIAELLGFGGPRQVGKAMGRGGSEVTWWRVIRSNGTLPNALQSVAAEHWARESTPCSPGGVRMKLARWQPSEEAHRRIEIVAGMLPVPKRHPRMI